MVHHYIQRTITLCTSKYSALPFHYMVHHYIFLGTEDDAGAVLGPLAEAADAKAMKGPGERGPRSQLLRKGGGAENMLILAVNAWAAQSALATQCTQ